MKALLLIFLMTDDGVKTQRLPEPDLMTCQVFAMQLNAFDRVKADCVEVK